MKRYILALDQGTTSSRAILFDREQTLVQAAQREFTQHYPKPGWVEHDAEEILAVQLQVAREALAKAGADAGEVAAIGITNQRETVVVWDKRTGRPICPAIVWQCRRTAEYCDALREKGLEPLAQAILAGADLSASAATAKHAAWYAAWKDQAPALTAENIMDVLKEQIGQTFRKVLLDAGVYKRDAQGQAGLDRFLKTL